MVEDAYATRFQVSLTKVVQSSRIGRVKKLLTGLPTEKQHAGVTAWFGDRRKPVPLIFLPISMTIDINIHTLMHHSEEGHWRIARIA